MKQLSTRLADRELRYDGVSIVDPDLIADLLLRGLPLCAMQATRGNLEVQLHNANCPHDPVVLAGAAPVQLSFGWNLPREYLDLTLDQLHDVLLEQVERDDLYQARIARLSEEIALFRTNGALPVLQAICYVLDSFRAAGQLWGVGRGSSCASYVLYLLGLHSVDSVKWEIPIDEFIHE